MADRPSGREFEPVPPFIMGSLGKKSKIESVILLWARAPRKHQAPDLHSRPGAGVILEAGLSGSQWCLRVLSLAGLASYLPQPQEGAAISQPQLLLQQRG